MEIITAKAAKNSMYAETNVLDGKVKPYEAVREEHHLCCVERQIMILAHTQTKLFFCCEGVVVMRIETHSNIADIAVGVSGHAVERLWLMTALGLIEIIHWKPIHV